MERSGYIFLLSPLAPSPTRALLVGSPGWAIPLHMRGHRWSVRGRRLGAVRGCAAQAQPPRPPTGALRRPISDRQETHFSFSGKPV